MPIDQVRFCVDKYLKDSYGFRAAATRPDLVEQANRLIGAAQAADAGAVLGVQTTKEDSDEIAFVVGSDGLFVVNASRYIPYAAIVATRSEYEDKQDFREIELELDDGSKVSLNVESGHGKLRDAYAISSFLGHLLRRLKHDHRAYQPSSI